MAKPTVKVEVAWTDGPYVAAPTWSDITTYVRSVSTSRGRTDDWQNFDSGSATLVLDNRDRRFDPTYTAGPNYGNLQPRRQIRITADAGTGSGYVDLFRGYVDGWPVRLSQAGYDSTVTITAYETLGLIAQDQVPADWSRDYALAMNPRHFWPLDDTIDPTNIPQTAGTLGNLTLRDLGGVPLPLQMAIEKTPIANTESLAPGIPSRSIISAASVQTAGYVWQAPETFTSGTLTTWFSPGNAQYNVSIYGMAVLGATSGVYMNYALYYNITNQRFEFYVGERATGVSQKTWRVYYFPTQLNLAIPHHAAIKYTDSTATTVLNLALFVDGQEVATTSNTTFLQAPGYGENAPSYSIVGNAQQFAIYFDLKTTAQIQELYRLGNNVLTETTAARFSRIITETPLPAALYSCTASPAGTVGRLTVGGAFVNNELQLTNDSEGGELYTTKAGVVTMTNRTWYQSGTSATSQATFGSGGIPIQTEIEYAWNANNIRNTLDVSWSGDAVVTVSDSTSRSTYGVMQDSWTTALSTYTDAQTLGNLLVGFGKLPRLVISAVEVGQALTAANWNTVLGLELLDRITVVVPEPVGSNLTQTQIIQQIEHDITPGDWKTRILGSARWSSVFTIGTSYLDGTDILG